MAANFEAHLYSLVKFMIKILSIFLAQYTQYTNTYKNIFPAKPFHIQQKESIPIISVRQVEMLMLENYISTVNIQYTC